MYFRIITENGLWLAQNLFVSYDSHQTLQSKLFFPQKTHVYEKKWQYLQNLDCAKLLQGIEQNKASEKKIEAIENNNDKAPVNKQAADGREDTGHTVKTDWMLHSGK